MSQKEQKVAVATDKDLFIDKSAALLDEESRKVKKTKDYSAEISTALPAILANYKVETLVETIHALLPWEKKARLASDLDSTIKITKLVLKLCFDNKKYDLLTEYLQYFVKSRAQMVAVIKTIIQYVLNIVLSGNETGKPIVLDAEKMGDEIPTQYEFSLDEKLPILNTIITVAEGRLCAEYEYATAVIYKTNLLTNVQSNIVPTATANKYESLSKEKLDEAFTLITKVPAEVVGSMNYYEKCTTLLNQAKLAILVKNLPKALNLLKKIRVTEISKYPELKYYYHLLSSEVHYNNNNFLDAARGYHQLYLLTKPSDEVSKIHSKDAGTTMGDEDGAKAHRQSSLDISAEYGKTLLAKLYFIDINAVFYPCAQPTIEFWILWLQRAIIAAILSPHDYESEQLLSLLTLPKHEQYLVQTNVYHLVRQFTSKQFIAWPITQSTPCSQILGDGSNDNLDINIFDALKQDDVFVFDTDTFDTKPTPITTTMSDDITTTAPNIDIFDTTVNKYELLYKRVIHHNIRMLAQNYTHIKLSHAVNVISIQGLTEDYFEAELREISEQVRSKIDRRAGVINFNTERGTGDAVLSKWAEDLVELFKLVENTEQFIQKARVVESAKKGQLAELEKERAQFSAVSSAD